METSNHLVSVPKVFIPGGGVCEEREGQVSSGESNRNKSMHFNMLQNSGGIGEAADDMPKKKKQNIRVPLIGAGFHFLFNSTGGTVDSEAHDGSTLLQCVQCAFKTENSSSLIRHTNRVHKKQFACDQCPFRTGRKEMLNAHILSNHNPNNSFKCTNCDFVATQKVELHKHILITHEGVKTFPCGMCSYTAVRKNHLERHIMSVHESTKAFECSQCPYKTPRKDKLDRHVSSVHDKLKPFACSFCSYRASRKTNLNKHINNFHCENITVSL